MKDIEIHKITEGDIPKIVDIWYDASIKAHNFIPDNYWEENKELMKSKYIPMSETYKAIQRAQILGFVCLTEEYLAAIFVKPEFQGKGIGSLLLNTAKNLRNTLKLKVFCKNMDSVEFYKSRGFSVISKSKDTDTDENELVMQWHKYNRT